MDGNRAPYDHPLFDDLAYIPPVPFLTYFKEQHAHHTYSKCPAWKSSLKNSYVFFSQTDVEINYNKDTGVVSDESFNHCTFDEATGLITELMPFGKQQGGPKDSPPYSGVAVGQLVQSVLFWPKDSKFKNMWLEIQPIPDMIQTHRAELIGGEFPFSRWFRPIMFAFKFYSEKTIFKRGDPIGIVKFKNIDNYLEEIFLEKIEPPDSMIRKIENHTRLKNFLPNKSWGLIKDNIAHNRCPFRKFWKRL
jgi:hypothetical protein